MPMVSKSRIRSGDGFITYSPDDPIDNGARLTQFQTNNSLAIGVGPRGEKGEKGDPGKDGEPGRPGIGINGAPGKSAYEIWLDEGYVGTQQDFLNWMRYDSSSFIAKSEKAAPLGVATLDSQGKIPQSQMPSELAGFMTYQGLWDASTNTPVLPNPNNTHRGKFWIVGESGSVDISGINNWFKNDWVFCTGSTYVKVDNQSSVRSVNGRTGDVVLTLNDVKGVVTSINSIKPDPQGNIDISEYVLPVANATRLGGVRADVDGGLVIDSNGFIRLGDDAGVGFRPSNTWFVSANNTSGDGSINNPFGSIETALSNVGDGDTVIVYGGYYTGTTQQQENTGTPPKTLLIDKQISLLGLNDTQLNYTLDVTAKDVNVRGINVNRLTVRNEPGSSIYDDIGFNGKRGSYPSISVVSTKKDSTVVFSNLRFTSGDVFATDEYTPNVWVGLQPTSKGTFQINGGHVRIDNANGVAIQHDNGFLEISNSHISDLRSTAQDNTDTIDITNRVLNYLDLYNSTFENPINKTGTCLYSFDLSSSNLSHVLNGVESNRRVDSRNVTERHIPANYTVDDATIHEHVKGLDEAITATNAAVDAIGIIPASDTGSSLVANTKGVLKRIKHGDHFSIAENNTSLTMNVVLPNMVKTINGKPPSEDGSYDLKQYVEYSIFLNGNDEHSKVVFMHTCKMGMKFDSFAVDTEGLETDVTFTVFHNNQSKGRISTNGTDTLTLDEVEPKDKIKITSDLDFDASVSLSLVFELTGE